MGETQVRPLVDAGFDAVRATDARSGGQPRRDSLEKRLRSEFWRAQPLAFERAP